MRKIWLINPYAMPPSHEMRIQTQKKGEYLAELGHSVTIIGGSFLHNKDVNLITDNKQFISAQYGKVKYIHIKTNSYKGNGLNRIVNLIVFYLRLYSLCNKFDKPDIISHIATIPFSNIIYFIAKKFKAKCIVEVVDLWPESFVALGLISKNNPILKFLYSTEKWIYEKSDLIVFSMEGGKDYIREKKWDLDSGGLININKVHYINNGVDITDFDHNKRNYTIEDSDLLNPTLFRVIYLGSIRLANDIRQLIDAAYLLRNYHNIIFLIYGDGPDRSFLEDYCTNNSITNVIFKQKWVDIKYVPFILSNSSLNILNYKKSYIYRFGGSQSKSFQYMASGKPICSNINMGYCPITKYNLGIAKDFCSSQEYADAILSIYNLDPHNYTLLCNNSRNTSQYYDYKTLTNKYIQLINNILYSK